jgi:hypothetical protein
MFAVSHPMSILEAGADFDRLNALYVDFAGNGATSASILYQLMIKPMAKHTTAS